MDRVSALHTVTYRYTRCCGENRLDRASASAFWLRGRQLDVHYVETADCCRRASRLITRTCTQANSDGGAAASSVEIETVKGDEQAGGREQSTLSPRAASPLPPAPLALVVEGGFSSCVELGATVYPWLPVRRSGSTSLTPFPDPLHMFAVTSCNRCATSCSTS